MYRADLDQLTALLDGLARDHESLEELADELAGDLAVLHQRWEGAAATAHGVAQAGWDTGFAAMRSALATMRSVAANARDNYASAAGSNVSMWERVS